MTCLLSTLPFSDIVSFFAFLCFFALDELLDVRLVHVHLYTFISLRQTSHSQVVSVNIFFCYPVPGSQKRGWCMECGVVWTLDLLTDDTM